MASPSSGKRLSPLFLISFGLLLFLGPLTQTIQITDPEKFHMVIQVYAQVCDDKSCHEFRATLENNGADEPFQDYRGNFDEQPKLPIQ